MKYKAVIVVAGILVAVLLMSVDGWAMRGKQSRVGAYKGYDIARVLAMKDVLTLTPEQDTALRTLYFDTKAQRIRDKAQRDEAKLELIRLTDAYALDEKKVQQAADALVDAKRKEIAGQITQAVAIRKILSPAQFDQLRTAYVSDVPAGRSDTCRRKMRPGGRSGKSGAGVPQQEKQPAVK